MSTPFDDVRVFSTSNRYDTSAREAYAMGDCPKCGAHQFVVIAVTLTQQQAWLRCINCNLAVVQNGVVSSPSPLPLRAPSGVEGEELAAWDEARRCLGVGAYTAAVMLCRKLLMHVAVANGLPAKNEKGRAPDFTMCVEHLMSIGLVTIRMKKWIDRIKDVGNEANHEIAPVSKDSAMDVAKFTQTLLELAYEMDYTMAQAEPTLPDVDAVE